MDSYKVDKQIPIPEEPVMLTDLFPLEQMDVGESIEFPAEYRKYIQSRVSTIKRRKGQTYTVRKVTDNACRVWRTA